jgi:hypothetical protein
MNYNFEFNCSNMKFYNIEAYSTGISIVISAMTDIQSVIYKKQELNAILDYYEL